MEILILLLIAGICGGLAQALVGYSGGGCFLSIAIGFIGALIGSWLARKFALPDFFEVTVGGNTFPVVWSIIGGVVFTAILNLLSPRRRV
ncbi:MAG: GlsB/YeaQ/YmgE family stress response membrane protein [Ignavibacteriaceae bacterium]